MTAPTATPTRDLHLRRATQQLVIDHVTFHYSLGRASIHYVEKDAAGNVIGGGDIDGVTPEESGGLTEVQSVGATLMAFVGGLAGIPVNVDQPATPTPAPAPTTPAPSPSTAALAPVPAPAP